MILDIDKINTYNGGHSMFTGIDADVYRMRDQLYVLCAHQVDLALRTSPEFGDVVPPDRVQGMRDSMLFWCHYSGVQKASVLSVKNMDADPHNITKWYLSGLQDEIARRQASFQKPAAQPDETMHKVRFINALVSPMIHTLQDYTRQQMRDKLHLDKTDGGLIDELLPTMAHMTAVGLIKDNLSEIKEDEVASAYYQLTKQIVDKFVSEPPRDDVRRLEGYIARTIMELSSDRHIMSLLRDEQRQIIQGIQAQDAE